MEAAAVGAIRVDGDGWSWLAVAMTRGGDDREDAADGEDADGEDEAELAAHGGVDPWQHCAAAAAGDFEPSTATEMDSVLSVSVDDVERNDRRNQEMTGHEVFWDDWLQACANICEHEESPDVEVRCAHGKKNSRIKNSVYVAVGRAVLRARGVRVDNGCVASQRACGCT